MLDACIDDELDAATAGQVAEHLASCPTCAGLRDQRVAMRSALRTNGLRHAAPPALLTTILRRIQQSEQPAARGQLLHWWQALVLAGSTAVFGALGGWWLAQPRALETVPEYAVTRHVASLAPAGPRIDVASSDRHLVRPWFQGRLDFSPPVRDLSAEGFVLAGARLDHVGGQPAAAVVYRLRGHVINVFSWRVLGNQSEPEREATVRGFHVATWSGGDINFAAVSDMDSAELLRFAAAYRGP
jgi:anti-sigma factor RsiW